jgi:predicted transcriptional regulator of viral defense system
LAAAERNIFTIEEARQASGADGANVARLLYRLAAKCWVQRLERGKYRLIPLEAGPDEGPQDAHWRLIINVPERQLLEWRELGGIYAATRWPFA